MVGWAWLFLVIISVCASNTSSSNRTKLLQVQELTHVDPEALCLDGSPAKYYTDKVGNQSATRWVLWFQGGGACAPESNCFDLIASDPFTTYAYPSSTYWDSEVVGQNLLSQSPQENAILHDAVHVYIPYCSQDLWRGSNMVNASSGVLHFRGRHIFAALLIDLSTRFGFEAVEHLVMGGASAGAIGALQSAREMRLFLDDLAEIMGRDPPALDVISDSGFFVDLEAYRSGWGNAETHPFEAMMYGAEHLWKATYDAECAAGLQAAEHMCLSANEVWRHIIDMPNSRLLFLQSQYDGYFLAAFAGLQEAESPSFVNAYLETYGAEIRAFMYTLQSHPRVSVFSPACVSHVYNYPVRFHGLEALPRVAEVGGIELSGPLSADTVHETRIGDFSMMDAMNHFVNRTTPNCAETAAGGGSAECTIHYDETDASGAYFFISDDCASLFCNEQCPATYEEEKRDVFFSIAVRRAMITVIIICLICIVVHYFYVQYNVAAFQTLYRNFWDEQDHHRGTHRIPTLIDVMKHAKNSKELHVSLRDVSYFMDKKSSDHRHHSRSKSSYWDWVPGYYSCAAVWKAGLYDSMFGKRKRSEIQLLKGVTVAVKPGEVTAIMGPSGCGKSTLLDILCLGRSTGRIEGSHYINGLETCKYPALRRFLKNNLGYVRQLDEFFPELSVREYLSFMAMLTLPQHMPFHLKQERVHQVIQVMMLSFRKHTPVGDGGRTVEGGLSGGQLRRLSVAAALLRMPRMLVLDEPTSGLDSSSSKLMVNCLSELARNTGCMVVLTIHQPRIELYKRFDRIVIMAVGKVLFSAPVDVMLRMFKVDKGANPGDFVIDILDEDDEDTIERLYKKWSSSDEYAKIDAEITESIVQMDGTRQKQFGVVLSASAYLAGNYSSSRPICLEDAETYWTAMCNARKKTWWEFYRRSFFVLFASLLLGVIFFDIEGAVNRWENRVSLLYLFVALCPLMQNTFVIQPWFAEKNMWTRAFSSGQIGWVEFLKSRLARMWAWGINDAILITVPCYWMAGLNPDIDRFGQTLLLNVLLTLVFNAFIVLVAVLIDDELTTGYLTAAYMGFCALFGGFVIRYSSIPSYMRWFTELLAGYWSFVGVMNADLRGASYACEYSTLVCVAEDGDSVLKLLQLDRYDQISCIFALASNFLLFILLAVPLFWFSFVRDTSLEKLNVTIDEELQAELQAVSMNSVVAVHKGDLVEIIKPGAQHCWHATVLDPDCVWDAAAAKFLCVKVRCEVDGVERTYAKKEVVPWKPAIDLFQTNDSSAGPRDSMDASKTELSVGARRRARSISAIKAISANLVFDSNTPLNKMWGRLRRDSAARLSASGGSFQQSGGGSAHAGVSLGSGQSGASSSDSTNGGHASARKELLGGTDATDTDALGVDIALLRDTALQTMQLKRLAVSRMQGMHGWLTMPKMSLNTLHTYVMELRSRGVNQAMQRMWTADLIVSAAILAAMSADDSLVYVYIPYIVIVVLIFAWPLYLKKSIAGEMIANYRHEDYIYATDIILTIADVAQLLLLSPLKIWVSIALYATRKLLRTVLTILSATVTDAIREHEAHHRHAVQHWESGMNTLRPRLADLSGRKINLKSQFGKPPKMHGLMDKLRFEGRLSPPSGVKKFPTTPSAIPSAVASPLGLAAFGSRSQAGPPGLAIPIPPRGSDEDTPLISRNDKVVYT